MKSYKPIIFLIMFSFILIIHNETSAQAIKEEFKKVIELKEKVEEGADNEHVYDLAVLLTKDYKGLLNIDAPFGYGHDNSVTIGDIEKIKDIVKREYKNKQNNTTIHITKEERKIILNASEKFITFNKDIEEIENGYVNIKHLKELNAGKYKRIYGENEELKRIDIKLYGVEDILEKEYKKEIKRQYAKSISYNERYLCDDRYIHIYVVPRYYTGTLNNVYNVDDYRFDNKYKTHTLYKTMKEKGINVAKPGVWVKGKNGEIINEIGIDMVSDGIWKMTIPEYVSNSKKEIKIVTDFMGQTEEVEFIADCSPSGELNVDKLTTDEWSEIAKELIAFEDIKSFEIKTNDYYKEYDLIELSFFYKAPYVYVKANKTQLSYDYQVKFDIRSLNDGTLEPHHYIKEGVFDGYMKFNPSEYETFEFIAKHKGTDGYNYKNGTKNYTLKIPSVYIDDTIHSDNVMLKLQILDMYKNLDLKTMEQPLYTDEELNRKITKNINKINELSEKNKLHTNKIEDYVKGVIKGEFLCQFPNLFKECSLKNVNDLNLRRDITYDMVELINLSDSSENVDKEFHKYWYKGSGGTVPYRKKITVREAKTYALAGQISKMYNFSEIGEEVSGLLRFLSKDERKKVSNAVKKLSDETNNRDSSPFIEIEVDIESSKEGEDVATKIKIANERLKATKNEVVIKDGKVVVIGTFDEYQNLEKTSALIEAITGYKGKEITNEEYQSHGKMSEFSVYEKVSFQTDVENEITDFLYRNEKVKNKEDVEKAVQLFSSYANASTQEERDTIETEIEYRFEREMSDNLIGVLSDEGNVSELLDTENLSTRVQSYVLSEQVSQETIESVNSVNKKTNNFALYLIGIAGSLAVIMYAATGYMYTTSQGDPRAMEKAKMTGVYTTIGLVICLLAFVILNLFAGL